MDYNDAIAMQKNLGVHADGIIGRNTLTMAFIKLGAGESRAADLALSANVHMRTYGILNNKLRFTHFMAQLAHESGGFRYMEEIASGSAYEGRRDLGNIYKGDGRLYKGRGVLMITGRANYRDYGEMLGINLEHDPTLAEDPSIGMLIACKYWDIHKLNDYADNDDIIAITKRINGGTNGLDDRKDRLRIIKRWF